MQQCLKTRVSPNLKRMSQASMAESPVQLKLLVDSKAHRVLFAEADKKVIDFLFTLLSLPLATVIRLVKKHSMVGCLENLYESVENLNETYLQPNQSKDSLLQPKFAFSGSPMLLPDIDSASTPKASFYLCYACYHPSCRDYFADYPNAVCPQCHNHMTKEGKYVKPGNGSGTAASASVGEGGIVKGVVTYMVMDDLSVKPMSTISSITLLNKFNIKQVDALEERVVTLDVNEGVKLLKASLLSKTVLTDVFLGGS